jgi:hypothetical protein
MGKSKYNKVQSFVCLFGLLIKLIARYNKLQSAGVVFWNMGA